jgi:hypothetical protein
MQPTYKRQRFLLAFIRQLQSDVILTDLQNLVFLHTMKNNSGFYEFIPYKFGAYSFQLTEDVDILRINGYLAASNNRIHAIGDYPKESSFQITTERGNSLVKRVYREYPYYTINSEITGRLFNVEEAEHIKNEKQKYTQTDQGLFTIGYEGLSLEAFINKLIQNNIMLLCDVRKNPFSRKFGFSKSKLKRIMETISIKYVHIPDLGIDTDKRSTLVSIEDYQNLFRCYEKTLNNLKHHLEWLYSQLCSNGRIALMCYEKDAVMCHRRIISNYIANRYEIGSHDL